MDFEQQLSRSSVTAIIASGIITLYIIYYILDNVLHIAVLSPAELVWNALVRSLPTSLVLSSAKREQLGADSTSSEIFAAKSDALREMLGFTSNAALFQKLPAATEAVGLSMSNIIRRKSVAVSAPPTSDVPSGLGNWDNSCYQNSVLQALTSLRSLRTWLDVSAVDIAKEEGTTTTSALRDLVAQLRDSNNNGKYIWTPAKLKNMSSWQQQDAQEYFSKIMDELDKDVKKAVRAKEVKAGLESLSDTADRAGDASSQPESTTHTEDVRRNPLEGWIAQRVACTRCGGSDGYSMIPFNCLTVPLGPAFSYSLEDCLYEYTKREDIEGVECRRCTLLSAEEKLKKIVTQAPGASKPASADNESVSKALALPPEIRSQVAHRLQAIQDALDKDDYSDKSLKSTCQIAEKAFVSSTKSREALIGRAPRSLVIHVNRSVFNEMTGMQSKNYAHVRYPVSIDLRPWMLRGGDTPVMYELNAVVTHKGAHENGHYICYRRHRRAISPSKAPDGQENDEGDWYQLSDADVYNAPEAEVLNPSAGGVFMLFYERVENSAPHKQLTDDELAAAVLVPLPVDELDDFEPCANSTPVEVSEVADDDVTIDDSLPPTVPPSVVSETDTDITDYDFADGLIEKSEHPVFSTSQNQHPFLRTAPPKDMMMDDPMRRNFTVMSV